jgi:hypothetical protein
MNVEPKRRFSGLGWSEHRHHLLEMLLPAIVDHPFERLTLVSLARISGISLWVLRRAFDNAQNLLRAATAHAIEAVLAELDYEEGDEAGVMDAIARYACYLARKMQSENYRNLLLIMIRNGSTVTWACQAYNERIIARICNDLETAVLNAGRRLGITVLMKEGVAKRLYKRIETSLALPSLLPGRIELAPGEIEHILEAAAKEAFASTFAYDDQGLWHPPAESFRPSSSKVAARA